MQVVGDKEVFAYQWELTDRGGAFYWGTFCFWINGIKVGDLEKATTLSICLYSLRDFLKMKGKRFYYRSEIVSKEKLFYEIYGKYFDYDYKGDKTASLNRCRDTYWLDEVGEDSVRDRIGVILLDEPVNDQQRLIWEYFDTGHIEEAFLPSNYFEHVSLNFMDLLSSEIELFDQ